MLTYQNIVTIFPSIIDNSTLRRSFYVNLYGQIAFRIIQNLQPEFLNMGSTPPPLLNNVKKNRRFGPERHLFMSQQKRPEPQMVRGASASRPLVGCWICLDLTAKRRNLKKYHVFCSSARTFGSPLYCVQILQPSTSWEQC